MAGTEKQSKSAEAKRALKAPAAGALPARKGPPGEDPASAAGGAAQGQKAPMVLSEIQAGKGVGMECPDCGCRDLRSEEGPGWDCLRTEPIPHARRRVKICRNCGRRIVTIERVARAIPKKE